MATRTYLSWSDAQHFPRDAGLFPDAGAYPDDDETWHSAGWLGMLARAYGGSSGRIVHGLGFTGHDGVNNTVDIEKGYALVFFTGSSLSEPVNVQTTKGGEDPPPHDTQVGGHIPVVVHLPTNYTDLSVSGRREIVLGIDHTGATETGRVFLEVLDRSVEAFPTEPHVFLGTADPDNASLDPYADYAQAEPAVIARNLSGQVLGGNRVSQLYDGNHLQVEFQPGASEYWLVVNNVAPADAGLHAQALNAELSGEVHFPVSGVAPGGPMDGYVLTWVEANSQWEPVAPTGGSGGGYTQNDITNADNPYSITDGESLWGDTSAGQLNVQLPDPTASAGFDSRVKHVASASPPNDCTLVRNGSELINQVASDLKISVGDAVVIECNGTNWEVVA